MGLAPIAAVLYFSNGGVDFTVTDLTGFGSLAVVVSGLLMQVGFIVTFLIIGSAFGLGFTLATDERR